MILSKHIYSLFKNRLAREAVCEGTIGFGFVWFVLGVGLGVGRSVLVSFLHSEEGVAR